MTCEYVPVPGGGTAIVCGLRSKRCRCGRRATLACDWKDAARKSGTCDAALCASCSTSPAPDKDLCPDHAAEFKRWKAERGRGE